VCGSGYVARSVPRQGWRHPEGCGTEPHHDKRAGHGTACGGVPRGRRVVSPALHCFPPIPVAGQAPRETPRHRPRNRGVHSRRGRQRRYPEAPIRLSVTPARPRDLLGDPAATPACHAEGPNGHTCRPGAPGRRVSHCRECTPIIRFCVERHSAADDFHLAAAEAGVVLRCRSCPSRGSRRRRCTAALARRQRRAPRRPNSAPAVLPRAGPVSRQHAVMSLHITA
jgi:hypothetical protein